MKRKKDEGVGSRRQVPFIPQTKLLRLFQIIGVLKTGRWTTQQLADRFDTSKRTIYRYLKLLEEVEFLVETDFENRYFIVTTDDDPLQAQFTIEEMSLIKEMILATATDTPVKDNLLRKLKLNSQLDAMPALFLKSHLGTVVERLSEAIRDKQAVLLRNYHSANSNEIRDRKVEPIHFGANFESVIALDIDDKICKQFKLDRLMEVVLLNQAFAYQDLHRKTNMDIFGFTGNDTLWITLSLSMRAYLLLREEHPLAIPYIEKQVDKYVFNGPVAGFEGAARFVLGLIDEVRIEAPAEFGAFVADKITHAQLPR